MMSDDKELKDSIKNIWWKSGCAHIMSEAASRAIIDEVERAVLAQVSQDDSCGCSNCEEGHPCEFSRALQQVPGDSLKSNPDNAIMDSFLDEFSKDYESIDRRLKKGIDLEKSQEGDHLNPDIGFRESQFKKILMEYFFKGAHFAKAMPTPKQEPVGKIISWINSSTAIVSVEGMNALCDGAVLYDHPAPPKAAAIPEHVANRNEWIFEKLSYHKFEREDLTIDDCLIYLESEWTKVYGRTTRQLVMQILSLLTQPSQKSYEPEGLREIVEAVAHIGVDFGFGSFVLSDEHIEKARELLSSAPKPEGE